MKTFKHNDAVVSYFEDDTHYFFTVARNGIAVKNMRFDKNVTDLSEAIAHAKDISSNYRVIDGIRHYTYTYCQLDGNIFASCVWCIYEEAKKRAGSVDVLHVYYSVGEQTIVVLADYRYKFMSAKVMKGHKITSEIILQHLDARVLFDSLADLLG